MAVVTLGAGQSLIGNATVIIGATPFTAEVSGAAPNLTFFVDQPIPVAITASLNYCVANTAAFGATVTQSAVFLMDSGTCPGQTVSTTFIGEPDLCTKAIFTVDNEWPLPGTQSCYTISTVNSGSGTNSNFIIHVILGSGQTLTGTPYASIDGVDVSAAVQISGTAPVLSFTVSKPIPVGAAAILSYCVDNSALDGTIVVNQAVIQSVIASCPEITATATISGIPNFCSGATLKVDDSTPVLGTNSCYRFEVSNTGSGASTNFAARIDLGNSQALFGIPTVTIGGIPYTPTVKITGSTITVTVNQPVVVNSPVVLDFCVSNAALVGSEVTTTVTAI
jgi:hypothetical protein